MADNDILPRPDPSNPGGGRNATPKLAAQQESRLRAMLQKEKEISGRALQETLEARELRDEFRRVLAASLRGEMILTDRCTELSVELDKRAALLNESLVEAGRLKGSNEELSERLALVTSAGDETAEVAKEELRQERKRFEEELNRMVLQRGIADGRVKELQARMESDAPAARMLRVRAIGLHVGASVAFAAAVAFLPPLFRALFGSSTTEEMQLAVGLGGWGLLGTEFCLLAVALALFNMGLRDFRASARA
jgi:hypothetical protein